MKSKMIVALMLAGLMSQNADAFLGLGEDRDYDDDRPYHRGLIERTLGAADDIAEGAVATADNLAEDTVDTAGYVADEATFGPERRAEDREEAREEQMGNRE
jgi:hypothetical protein